jgi:hypothetical protein
MDYESLVLRIGLLYSMLLEIQKENLYQGEHTIVYMDQTGTKHTIYAHIDGTEFQIFSGEGFPVGFNIEMS